MSIPDAGANVRAAVLHWLVLPKLLGDPVRVITLAEAVAEWERLGYTVLGPYALAEQPQTAHPADTQSGEI